MVRRVVSILHGNGGGSWAAAPSVEANAYAVAEEIELTLVLRGAGTELALAHVGGGQDELAGERLPALTGGQDLRALLESGVPVVVDEACLAELGLAADDLLEGVEVVEAPRVLDLLADADAVLRW